MFVRRLFISDKIRKMSMKPISYLTQQQSKDIDEELFNDYKFSVDQLMELAGLSCAAAIGFQEMIFLPEEELNCDFICLSFLEKAYSDKSKYSKCLVIAGGGNNGGDGLVCARHLKMFGFQPLIFYPKRTEKDLYRNLVRQCEKMDIEFVDRIPDEKNRFDLIVDAIFGFGFSGEIRQPFSDILKQLKSYENQLPIVSIDVPSGWHVEDGPISENSIQPECVVSLTAPKVCMKHYRGRFHFLGGRFLPPALQQKYSLILPEYASDDQIVQI